MNNVPEMEQSTIYGLGLAEWRLIAQFACMVKDWPTSHLLTSFSVVVFQPDTPIHSNDISEETVVLEPKKRKESCAEKTRRMYVRTYTVSPANPFLCLFRLTAAPESYKG